ncbi:MAG: NUDIX hydrolase [Proteobacteria bacterium]|nr:NUDIX hydrolase [Pseudomonadota bacterium]
MNKHADKHREDSPADRSAAEAEADAPLETLYEGRWLRMVRRGRWEYAERTHGERGMAVIVIAVTPADNVLFVEQFRMPLRARTIEMPAGLVGDDRADDSLAEAAHRELIEETGWRPEHVDVLLTGPTSSGMSSERIAFVRARALSKVGAGGGVDGEDIIVHEVPRTQAPAWLMQKHAEGYEVDLKLWAGLWMIEFNPDGSPAG